MFTADSRNFAGGVGFHKIQDEAHLGLDPPENRLAVPRFFMNGRKNGANNSAKPVSGGLTEQELKETRERLSIESERRSRAKPKFLRILVDGIQCSRLVNAAGSRSQCQITESANLIEVWTDFEGEDLLLATHWIEYTRFRGIARAAATVDLADGTELFLEIAPQSGHDYSSYAQLFLECRPASIMERTQELLINRSSWLLRFPRYALLSLLVFSLGWTIARTRTSREQRAAIERLDQELAQERAARISEKKHGSQEQTVESFLLVPDENGEDRTRGGEGTGEQFVAFPAHATQVILQLPRPKGVQMTYKGTLKSFPEGRDVLVENFPKPADSLQAPPLEFVLPKSFVRAGEYYVIELSSTGSTVRSERIHTFTFYLSKR